jgi:hypothetical protein
MRGPKSNRRSERKSCEYDRQMKLFVEPIQSGPNVFDLPFTTVVLAMAQSGAAKVEAQHRKSKIVQRLRSVEDNLVVQGSSEQRVRMTDDRSMRGVFRARVDQGFQTSGRTIEKERTNC